MPTKSTTADAEVEPCASGPETHQVDFFGPEDEAHARRWQAIERLAGNGRSHHDDPDLKTETLVMAMRGSKSSKPYVTEVHSNGMRRDLAVSVEHGILEFIDPTCPAWFQARSAKGSQRIRDEARGWRDHDPGVMESALPRRQDPATQAYAQAIYRQQQAEIARRTTGPVQDWSQYRGWTRPEDSK